MAEGDVFEEDAFILGISVVSAVSVAFSVQASKVRAPRYADRYRKGNWPLRFDVFRLAMIVFHVGRAVGRSPSRFRFPMVTLTACTRIGTP